MTEKTDRWAGDLLNRRQDAEFLYNFLIGQAEKRQQQGRTASYVINVDADWGGGKSFFLDGLAQDIEAKGHLVARINAWRDDHAQDPYVAIMAAIEKAFEPFIKKPGKIKKAWTATKSSGGAIALKMGGSVLKNLLKKHGGIDVDQLVDIIGAEELPGEVAEEVIEEGVKAAGEQLDKLFDATLEAMIEGFKRTDAAMIDFRSKLEAAIEAVSSHKQWPLFVMIDELDRCRPTYAVQLLERVKHLFDVPGVFFVFATNADQLQHSISGAYGANFDGFRYLKRFFDRTYVFEKPSTENYIKSLAARLPTRKLRAPENNLVKALESGFEAYGFDLRAIEHVMEMIDASATAWTHELPADIVLPFPLCAHFYKTGNAEWPVEQVELDQWVWARSRIDQFERKNIDTSINYGEAYSVGISVFRSMDSMMQMGRTQRRDIATDYIYETFSPEWNGVQVSRQQPSIQTELLGLVANAGRLVDRIDEKDGSVAT